MKIKNFVQFKSIKASFCRHIDIFLELVMRNIFSLPSTLCFLLIFFSSLINENYKERVFLKWYLKTLPQTIMWVNWKLLNSQICPINERKVIELNLIVKQKLIYGHSGNEVQIICSLWHRLTLCSEAIWEKDGEGRRWRRQILLFIHFDSFITLYA